MKRYRVLIALSALLLPVIARTLWFYRGIYQTPPSVPTPEYAALSVPTPPLATIEPPEAVVEAPGKVILLDWAHENQFEIPELEVLISGLTASGAQLEVLQVTFDSSSLPLEEHLKYASAYVVVAPLDKFTPAEVRQVDQFVQKGGRVLVIADPTRDGGSPVQFESSFGFLIGDVASANGLLAPFDLAFSQDYLYDLLENEGNYRNVLLSDFADAPLTEGISTVVFYAARSVRTTTGTALILAGEHTLSSRTDAGGDLSAAVLSQDGGVLALGDFTFLTTPYNQVADNPRLIDNLVEFLLSGERAHDLADFPYIFNQPVVLLQTEGLPLSAETLSSLGAMQASLSSLGLRLTLADEPPAGSDRIVLGLYSPSDDVRPYLEPFDLTLPEDSSDGTMRVPGFGKVKPAGTGLMLLSRTGDGITLVLLAESNELLLRLVDLLAGRDLFGCIVQDQVALCPLGMGEGFGGG
jgi:hypothetical protein